MKSTTVTYKTNPRLVRIYSGMLTRCYNPNTDYYKDYGGRGIEVCAEWLEDRNKFYEWALSNGYADNLQIDRKNVNWNYAPGNCRFVTNKINSRNKRDTIYVTDFNEKKPLAEVIEEKGLCNSYVREKISRGFTPNQAVEFFDLDLADRAKMRRESKKSKILSLKKIIDENYCFMEFIG